MIWFNPHDPKDLAARLSHLDAEYSRFKEQAVAQVGQMRQRTWREVADEYWAVMMRVASDVGGVGGD